MRATRGAHHPLHSQRSPWGTSYGRGPSRVGCDGSLPPHDAAGPHLECFSDQASRFPQNRSASCRVGRIPTQEKEEELENGLKADPSHTHLKMILIKDLFLAHIAEIRLDG